MNQKLLNEKQKILKTLAILENIIQGSIVMRKHTCGKSNCKCKRAEKDRHTSYQLTFAVDGKTKTITIPKYKLHDVKKGLRQYRHFRQLVKRLLEINRNLIKKNPF